MWKYVAFVLLIIFCVPGNSSDLPKVNESMEVGPTENNTDTSGTNTSETTSSVSVTTSNVETTTGVSVTTLDTTTAVKTTANATETTVIVTTVSPVTTTSAPTTTALPPPDVGSYEVKGDHNNTCLRVEMALRVEISDLHVLYNFPQNASTEGSTCNTTDYTEMLKLTDEHLGHSLTLIFVQGKKNYVQNISFAYSPSVDVRTSGQYFPASEGKSYLCKSEVAIKVDNVTLHFSSIRMQSYGAESFGLAEECDADDKVGDIVPIAVGCALGALVIVVLIAYLVGRRRSRQRGYQSV